MTLVVSQRVFGGEELLRVTIDLAKLVFECRAMEVCLQCELVPEPHTELATRDGAARTQPCSCQCRETLPRGFCLRQSKFVAPCLAIGKDCRNISKMKR